MTKPVTGKLYNCKMRTGHTRTLRYGFHGLKIAGDWSKWKDSTIWEGWRDHKNGRFVRRIEVVGFEVMK